jgi:lipoprotein-releasing system permease protein
MGYPVSIAFRYLRSRKAAFVSVGTLFAILGVALGVAALATVMSVTGGFQSQFRDKVLGVNAHVLVLKYSADFREYRDIMKLVAAEPGVTGVGPFTINPMMVTHGTRTATGVLLKGVDPELMPKVLDLPKHIVKPEPKPGQAPQQREEEVNGVIAGLRRAGAMPAKKSSDPPRWPTAPPTLGSTGLLPLPVDDTRADIGDYEKDDAGRPLALMRAIEKQIAEAEARKAAGTPDAGKHEPKLAASPDAGASADQALAVGAPQGSIEPDGGYASKLPDEDEELPPGIVPDACGNPEDVARLPGAIVGTTLAKNLELSLGDCLQVTSPTIGYSYSGNVLRPPVAKQFRVVAVFEAGFDQYDSKLVYTDLFEAQTFYDSGDSVTGVEMKVADIDDAKIIARKIDTKLSNGIYHTMDWEELNHGLFTALRIQQIGMSAVLALIIVVAAFTVVATLIMVVLDKKKEIAVLKAMGASDDAILRIFLYQGGIIGILGTLVGLALGLGVCKGLLVYGFPLDPKVYFISRLPVDVRPTEFLLTGGIAISICLLATVAPALYAAWLRPAEGLRDLG